MAFRNFLAALAIACFAGLCLPACQKNEVDPNELNKIAKQQSNNPEVQAPTPETVESPKDIRRGRGGAGP